MSMNKQQTIEALCEIVGNVYNSVGDFTFPSDCFCDPDINDSNYQNDGRIISYIRRAVNKVLIEDGLTPILKINDKTGEYRTCKSRKHL